MFRLTYEISGDIDDDLDEEAGDDNNDNEEALRVSAASSSPDDNSITQQTPLYGQPNSDVVRNHLFGDSISKSSSKE